MMDGKTYGKTYGSLAKGAGRGKDKNKDKDKDKAYLHWLYSNLGMGSHRLFSLLRSLAPPAQLYALARQRRLVPYFEQRYRGQKMPYLDKYRSKIHCLEQRAGEGDAAGEYEKMLARGIHFTVAGDTDYPEKLAQIPDAPGALYYVGRLPAADKKTIAVIGARNCTEYGKAVAKEFAAALAQADIQVISGMARGIDGIAQQAAIRAGGYSLAVFGCGVDICYPPENRSLYEELIASGGVCSEYPPGIEPRSVLFPPRNRIISGLCDGVLVIEAKERSGTLITVDMALEQGREVYAVPGRITDPLSRGCNELIRQGAGLAVSPQELTGMAVGERRKNASESDDMRGRILKLLDYQPQPVEEIKQKYDATYGTPESPSVSISLLYYELVGLCADGEAAQIGGSYVKKG